MSSNNDSTHVEGQQNIDLDLIIRKYGAERLGGEIDKVDTSEVKVTQLSVVYQSNKDWFRDVSVHEEIFDNPRESSDSTWRYTHTVQFSSQATWRLTRGYSSKLLPTLRLAVDYPLSEEGKPPLRGSFERVEAGLIATASGGRMEWNVDEEVNVKPLTSVKASATARVCKLKEVSFSTDIMMSGLIKLHCKKPSKIAKSSDLSASVEDILGSDPNFTIIDQAPNNEGANDTYSVTSKKVCFRVEGVCTGEVGLGACVRLKEVQSLV